MKSAHHIALLTALFVLACQMAVAKGEARHHSPAMFQPQMIPVAHLPLSDSDRVASPGLQSNGPAAIQKTQPPILTKDTNPAASGFSSHENRSAKKAERLSKKTALHIFGAKRQGLALVLAIFFGVLGLHRFYLGYVGIGLIQLLTLGGLFVWFIVDAFRIGFGKLVPFGGPYAYRLGKDEEE